MKARVDGGNGREAFCHAIDGLLGVARKTVHHVQRKHLHQHQAQSGDLHQSVSFVNMGGRAKLKTHKEAD